MHYRAYGLTIVLLLVSGSQAFCQSVTEQVGTFSMPAPSSCGGHTWCSSTARDALQRNGLKVSTSGPDVIFGAGSKVIAVVSCVDQGDHSFATLVAASIDSAAAESTRNTVRSTMVKAGCL